MKLSIEIIIFLITLCIFILNFIDLAKGEYDGSVCENGTWLDKSAEATAVYLKPDATVYRPTPEFRPRASRYRYNESLDHTVRHFHLFLFYF
jgi:hypothetical protein